MNRHIKTILLISLLIALISTISYCSAPYDTEVAKTITIRKTVSGEGFILRNEAIIEQPKGGVFESAVKDGTRVSGGSTIGATISSNSNEELVKKLEDVTKRIEEIQKSSNFADIYASDEARIYSALRDITKEIRSNTKNGNFALAAQNTHQLQTLLEKKYTTENSGAAQELLSELEEEKKSLEAQLGSIRENVYAPSAGYFYTTLDGLEQNRPEKELFAISTAEIYGFSKTLSEYKKPQSHKGKIVDTYSWYLVASLPKKEADLLSAGASVTLSIDEGAPLIATVSAVNYDDRDSAAVIVKCTRNANGIFEKRDVNFEICYEEYSGFYVPAAAIRVKNDITGVYVINQNETVSFRAIDILLQEDDFVIAKNASRTPAESQYSPLKLYDNILVNPEVIKESELAK